MWAGARGLDPDKTKAAELLGKKWEISLFLKETNQEAENHTQPDERASWFYKAVGVTGGKPAKNWIARGLVEAPQRGWTVIGMKDDWKTIYSSMTK